ncbi:MAG: malate/lactate/ureidoglycolate dehydrogenase [Hyphomicrobiaceae bacterium]|nr:malate/lactate/ureidoglycolate dehydrogenase [Hyphomicrobiaceae bacterium]
MADDIIIAAPKLTAAIEAIVAKGGSNAREAKLVATNLVEANLKGHDSHGVGMIPRYILSLMEGGLKVNQAPKLVLDTGPIIRMDGQAGYGQVIGHDAMTIAIERARQHGLCAAGLYHAHHIGRIGAWAEMAVAEGLVSLHFVNVVSRPIVAAWGGGDARFGTNPICIGVPREGKDPIVLDFATSRIAQGKTRVAHNRGKKLDPGTIIDDEGRPTTDPRYTVIPPFGAIMTFGEHKGYGLAMIAELLGGALTGGDTMRKPYDGTLQGVYNGMMTIVLDPKRLGTSEHFQREIDAFTSWVQSGPVAQGFDKVRLAGDPEREWKAKRLKEGIPVDTTTWGDILASAEKVGLAARDVAAIAGVAA